MGIKGKLCKHTIALTYDRDPEFPIDPRLRAKKLHSRKRGVGRPAKVKEALNKSPAKNMIENVDYIETGEEEIEICNIDWDNNHPITIPDTADTSPEVSPEVYCPEIVTNRTRNKRKAETIVENSSKRKNVTNPGDNESTDTEVPKGMEKCNFCGFVISKKSIRAHERSKKCMKARQGYNP